MSSPAKILICDDDPAILQLLSFQLKDEGYDIVICSDGIEAYEIIAKDLEIKLLITDIMMPNMSGYDLIETLHITDSILPVIVISGFAEDEKVIKLSDYPNVSRILAKPWEKKDILQCVSNALNPSGSDQ